MRNRGQNTIFWIRQLAECAMPETSRCGLEYGHCYHFVRVLARNFLRDKQSDLVVVLAFKIFSHFCKPDVAVFIQNELCGMTVGMGQVVIF